MIIETHCHLDYLKQAPLAEIVQMSHDQGIERIVTISVDPLNIDEVLKVAATFPHVYCTQGIHPHEAKDMTDDILEKIRSRSKLPKVVAVGEIGLDFHYNHSARDIQIKRFKEQLQVASEVDLPVVIHSRDADEEMMEILGEYAPKLKRKGVIHSFSSGLELAKFALSQDFFLGFNGIITFPKAENVRDAVRLCPIEKMLFETDAPFLTPVPHRGKENAPFYLPFVIQKIAEIKGIKPEDLKHQVYKSSLQFFWPS